MNNSDDGKKWAAMIGSAKVPPEVVKESRAEYGLDSGVRASAFFGEDSPSPRPAPAREATGHTLH